jgi:hypothetical protein
VVIEKIITKTIPLWNQTLGPRKLAYFAQYGGRIPYTECTYDPDPENGPEEDGPQQQSDEDEDEYYERREQWYEDTRRVVQPEPRGEFQVKEHHRLASYMDPATGKLKDDWSFDIWRDYKERGLQFIVKLANIHLTPEKPEYGGGAWHVEGQLVCIMTLPLA